ncbi:HEAT repeat domain-containing protein, partial [Oscillochloris sp. ZM17-4]|uniref:HEAT repeat domain-containing protein n=1 Tax=Oscillochloris sp. ZM17-4 TaxID=2866714 RepID=UPI001C73BC4D
PAPLRAAAARLLGAAAAVDAAPQLRRALLGDGPPILRRSSAAALAALAHAPGGGRIAVAALIEAISRPDPDAALTCSVAAALAAAGAVVAAPALSTLLNPGRPAALRAGWLAAVPALAHTPVDLWQAIPLDPGTRAVLLDSLAAGDTSDDQPSSLDELGRRQAEGAAAAAAAALATLAELRPDLADELCSRLRHAILHAPGALPPAGLLDALAHAAGDSVAAELEAILDSPTGTPALRWAAIERLGRAPSVAAWARGRLRAGGDDPFTLGKLAMILGDLGDQRALPDLQQIAVSGVAESYLRDSAVVAMGKIGGADADTALRAIITAIDAPEQLRARAVTALPQPLSDETRRALRQIVRAEGGAIPLTVAIGLTLARAGEREALPLLLRAAQSERAEDAARAIAALGDMGDQSAAPALVRISQGVTAAPGLRLAAVAALLDLDGAAQLPLLHGYLDSPLPPIRLRAHQILAKVAPGDPRLIAPVSDMSAPLVLRVDALERLMASHPTLSLASAILKHADEPPQLRICAARALGRSGRPEAVRALIEALGTDGPPLLRRSCVLALGA